MKDKKGPVRTILILAANPIGTNRLRLEEEVRDIEEGLKRSKCRDQFNLKQRWAIRIRDLRRVLLDHEPQIVHFTGHGETNGLLVEDRQGFAKLVSPGALAGLFKLHSEQIECVVLSACYSDRQAYAINKHIKYVIGMPVQIKDKAAIEFAVGFYDALGAGKTVEEAHKFGCNAIMQYWPEIPLWQYPKLHINHRIRKKKKRKHLVTALMAFFILAAFLAGLHWKAISEKSDSVTPLIKKNTTHNVAIPVTRSDVKVEVQPDTTSERAAAPPKTVPNEVTEIRPKVNQKEEIGAPPKANPNEETGVKPKVNPEDGIVVYITRTGRKYHLGHCSYLRSSKIPVTLREAKKRGCTACSRCRPPD